MDILKKVNYIFNAKQKTGFVANVILALISAMFELIGLSALYSLVNVIMDETKIETNKYFSMFADFFNVHELKSFLISFSIALIIVYVVKNVFLMFRLKFQMKYIYTNKKALALRLMNCYMGQDYLFHVEHAATELQRNVDKDVVNFISVISALISSLVEVFTLICMIVFLSVTDIITTLLLAGIFGLAFLFILKVYRKYQVQAGVDAREANKELNKWLMQSFGGIKELKVLNREKFFLNNYSNAYDKSNRAALRNSLLSHYPKYITEMLMIGGLLLTIIVRIAMGVDPRTFATTLSAFAIAAMRMLPAFNRISEYTANVLYGKASVVAIHEDLEQADRIKKEIAEHKTSKVLELNNEIKVEGVEFKYPEGDKNIFTGASFTIKKNQSVALIGESGSGKTTMADIMLGLLRPQKGSVTVDGLDIFENEDAWHSSVGYIPQMIYLIDDTIRANVAFGHEDIDDERVWSVLKDAQLDEYVKSLSKGLDTVVGDRGVKLSGGQRQRIGIARALYSRPAVLFLDEATSALDTETENAVMESINYLQGKTTLVIIAHRLSTIRNCDCIYEVGEGVVRLRDKKSVFEQESQKLKNAVGSDISEA
jgi:ABC-type multidrug transport system fused ATPase/permease subunit